MRSLAYAPLGVFRHPQWRVRIGLMSAVAVLSLCFARYLIAAKWAIGFPFGLDYGEGIVWQQMRMIMSGQGYGSIAGFPAIVFHYPPAYHLVTAFLAGVTGMDQLAAGRLVSVCSTLFTAWIIGVIVAQLARADTNDNSARVCGLLAGLMTLNIAPVLSWSVLMRVDMLSIALSFAGLYFGLRALTQARAVHIAAVLFVGAVYTKQTSIAAPCAVFGVLLLLHPRTALQGMGTAIITGLAALGALQWMTHGEFLRHIISYNINRFLLSSLWELVAYFAGVSVIYLLAAFYGVWAQSRRRFQAYRGLSRAQARRLLIDSPSDAGFVMVLAYFALATPMLATAAKSGGFINYFLEWGCLMTLFAGLSLVDVVKAADGQVRDAMTEKRSVQLLLLIVAQAFVLTFMMRPVYTENLAPADETRRLVSMMRAAAQPVISDNMVAVLRAGKHVQWEPAIFAELASKDIWDEEPFISKIRAREFSFFVTEGWPNSGDRYTPVVSRAIETTYPVTMKLAGYVLHFPSGPLPAYAEKVQ